MKDVVIFRIFIFCLIPVIICHLIGKYFLCSLASVILLTYYLALRMANTYFHCYLILD